MSDNSKISIRFFDDREVRAVWDDENSKWWFSVLDIVAVLTDQDDYNKIHDAQAAVGTGIILTANNAIEGDIGIIIIDVK